MTDAELRAKAASLRALAVEAAARSNSSHIGGVLSMMDILTFLFYEAMGDGDHFVLSKGHAALGLYAVQYDKGLITKDDFDSYHSNGSALIGHPSHLVPGVEVSTGSLGHGLAIAAGLALGLRRQGRQGHVYCLLGDGECQEGAIWESCIAISRWQLDNLTVVVDANGWQGFSDPCADLMPHASIFEMLQACGMEAVRIDGHDMGSLRSSIGKPANRSRAIVARTVKGKGVSFMEDRFEWHYWSPDSDQLRVALDELE